jgi:diguanylate cyclase (GGDEF)-like protein
MSFNPTLDAVPDVSLPLRAHRLGGARGGWGWGFLPSFAAALIGTMLSIAAALVVSRWEDRNAERTFDVIAENHSMALQHGLDEYLTKLMALRALFDSEDTVGRGEFEAFAQALLRYNSDAQTLSWLPRVRRDERAAFELTAAREGRAGYGIQSRAADGSLYPSPPHDEYFPVRYSTVPEASPLYGLDLRSDPAIRAELERAGDGDRLGTFAVPALITASGTQAGFVFLLPVYRQGLPHDTLDERRRNLVGFVDGAVSTARLIESVLDATTTPQGIDLFFFDPHGAPETLPVYIHNSRLRQQPLEPTPRRALDAGPSWSRDLKARREPWLTLVAAPMPGGPLAARHDRACIVLGAGLIITIGVVIYLGGVARHTHNLSRANAKISELAQTDALTGVANRRAFVARLKEAFANAARGSPPFAVLYFDLDHFKDVNDTLGHPLGDVLLRQVAARVKGAVRKQDLVARLGGDEFALLQTDAADLSAAGTLAVKIGTVVAAPYLIEGSEARVTASIGISRYSPDIAGPDAMMTQADLALYRAKEDGRNCVRFHSDDLDRDFKRRVTIADELRGALDRGEIEAHYQPQVELASGRIVGLEALMRWNHPKRGFVPPSEFIPVAEQTGLILPLGRWIFEEACRQLAAWQAQGIAPKLVAVNFSAVQFKSASDLEQEIADILGRHAVDPATVEIELTESVLMEVAQQHSATFERLRRLGVRIAIDDFGTGYSSLNYLTAYPVNRLKIAQELVFKVDRDFRHDTVVRAAVRLAHELGIECIAEGVETEAQARFLVAAGCEHGQGYHFSRPVAAGRATELLRRGRARSAPALLQVVGKTVA